MRTFHSSFARLKLKDHNPYYAAMRHSADGGYDWLDPSTVSGAPGVSQSLADLADAQIPHWAKANQVVRIAQITITLTKDTP